MESGGDKNSIVVKGYLYSQSGFFGSWRKRWFTLQVGSQTLLKYKTEGALKLSGTLKLSKSVSVLQGEASLMHKGKELFPLHLQSEKGKKSMRTFAAETEDSRDRKQNE